MVFLNNEKSYFPLQIMVRDVFLKDIEKNFSHLTSNILSSFTEFHNLTSRNLFREFSSV